MVPSEFPTLLLNTKDKKRQKPTSKQKNPKPPKQNLPNNVYAERFSIILYGRSLLLGITLKIEVHIF